MKKRLMIVGLGYVGIQLAYAFACSDMYEVVGFDVDQKKIEDYKTGYDMTGEIGSAIQDANIEWCDNLQSIEQCDIYIITVSTPTERGKPIYVYVDNATKMVAEHMPKGALVIYESTYPPYTTEKRCVPLLEQYSQLVAFDDFHFAYSPERINPGDKVHTLSTVTKLVAGGNEHAAKLAHTVYRSIIEDVKTVKSISIAEAAKIVENSQRDVNIALMNQFSMLYPDIEMVEMIEAMNTKWNALGFYNGLVGGHCVAEDPYYLIDQQVQKGWNFTILEEARTINERYVSYVANQICQLLSKDEEVLFFGLTFKPNTPDVRNSKALEIYFDLQRRGYRLLAVDPYALHINQAVQPFQSIVYATEEQIKTVKTRIYSVGHTQFQEEKIAMNPNIKKIINVASVLQPQLLKSDIAYFTI